MDSTFKIGDIVMRIGHNYTSSVHNCLVGHLYVVEGYYNHENATGINLFGAGKGFAEDKFVNLGTDITDLERIIWNLPIIVKS